MSAGDEHGTCVVIEDHSMVRAAIIAGLDPWLDVVGDAFDGTSGLRMLEELHPDVAVVDIRMPGMDGIDVVRRARELQLRTRIVLHSAFVSSGTLLAAREAGAFACISKSAHPDALHDALRAALRSVERDRAVT